MNCGEMADSYICSHCGKESYIKTDQKDNKTLKAANKSRNNIEQTYSKSNKEKNPCSVLSETGIKREVNSSMEKINANITGIGKAIKGILCAFVVLFIAQAVILVMNYSDIKKSVRDLGEANKELSALVSSQVEKINNLKKAIDENTDSQTDAKTDSQIEYVIHTVGKGETMTEICKNYNIDFRANKKIICALNGIENSDIIQVGQILILPILK